MNSGARRTIGSRAFSVFRSARIRWRTVSIDGAKPWNDANGWMDGSEGTAITCASRALFPLIYSTAETFHHCTKSPRLSFSLSPPSRAWFKTRPDVFGLFRSCTRCVSRSTDVTVGGGSALISRNEWDK